VGVYFHVQQVRKGRNDLYYYYDGDYEIIELSHFIDLFYSDEDNSFQDLLPDDISLEWYYQAFCDSKSEKIGMDQYSGITEVYTWDPREVIEDVIKVIETLRDNSSSLPHHFIVRPSCNQSYSGSCDVFYQSRKYHIHGDWDSCQSYPEIEGIDLMRIKELKCHAISRDNKNQGKDEMIGEEITLNFKKISMHSYYGPSFEGIKRVCESAIQNDNRLFTLF